MPDALWPDQAGPIGKFKPILEPLEDFRTRVSTLRGVCNRVRGLGDGHMRGMSCLLTGNELFPGNIVGGGGSTPAGWAKSLSIDQHIKNLLQADEQTRTRFGSLEFGVAVPNRADTWTRMCYAGPNQPVAPISDPRQMVDKLYGEVKDKQSLLSIVDGVKDDLKRVSGQLSPEDRELLERHLELVADMQAKLELADANDSRHHPVPDIDPEIELVNDNTPQVSRVQLDLVVSALANNMSRVSTIQYMRSVGMARMKWLDVEEGHHTLSTSRTTTRTHATNSSASTAGSPARSPTSRNSSPIRPSPAASAGPCSTTPSSSGPTSWARATTTRTTTSRSC